MLPECQVNDCIHKRMIRNHASLWSFCKIYYIGNNQGKTKSSTGSETQRESNCEEQKLSITKQVRFKSSVCLRESYTTAECKTAERSSIYTGRRLAVFNHRKLLKPFLRLTNHSAVNQFLAGDDRK